MGQLAATLILLATLARAELPPQAFGDMLSLADVFNAREYGDCILWLDASAEETITMNGITNVAAWSDKSTAQNHFSQPTNAVQPHRVQNAQANKPGIQFLAAQADRMYCTNNFGITSNLTILTVMRIASTSAANFGRIMVAENIWGTVLNVVSPTFAYRWYGSGVDADYVFPNLSTNAPYVLAASYDGNGLEGWVWPSNRVIAKTGTLSAQNVPVTLGNRMGGDRGGNFLFHEVVMWRAALTPSQLSNAVIRLKSKWELP